MCHADKNCVSGEQPGSRGGAQSRKTGMERDQKRTHWRDTDKRRAHAGVQSSLEPIARNALAHDVDSGRVDALLGGLQADLDKVEGMANNDGADATEAAGGEGAELRKPRGCGGFCVGFYFVLGLGKAWELVIEGLVQGGGGVVLGGCHGCQRAARDEVAVEGA